MSKTDFPIKVIIGKDGYVGQELTSFLKSKNQAFLATSRKNEMGTVFLDIRDASTFFFQKIPSNSLIYLLASISSPDICEKKVDFAKSVNIDATTTLIENCLLCGHRVCFSSSDAVFGGNDTVCFDNTDAKPLGKYGEMKLEIENKFEKYANFKSVRFSYILSGKDKFTNYLKECLAKKETAELYDPFLRSVVGLNNVVEGLASLDRYWESMPNKINFCGPQVVSREDIAKTFIEVSEKNLSYKVTRPKEEFFKTRARIIEMRSNYFPSLLGRRPSSLKEIYELSLNMETLK